MIEPQVIPIKFGQGIDTKSDPKTVVAGRLLRLQDAVQIAANQWRKRNGYTPITNAILGGGNITSPKLLTTFQNELVCADSVLGQLYSYSPTQLAWVPKGSYVPTAVTKSTISRYYGGSNHSGTTGAALGNIAVFAWYTTIALGSIQCQASVVDLSTGVTLISDYTLPNSVTGFPRCVVIGGTTLGIVYLGTGNHPTLITLNITAGGASFNSPVVLTTDVATAMDAVGTVTAAAACYKVGSTVKTITFNAAGSVSNSVTASISGSTSYACIMSEPTSNNIWVYWNDDLTLKYAVYSSSLSAVLAATTIVTNVWTTGFNFVAAQGATGTQTLIYSGSSLNQLDVLGTTNKVQVQSNGTVGTPALFAQNVSVYSKVFTLNSVQYVTCFYNSRDQGTYFALNVSDGTVLAKAIPGSAGSVTYQGYNAQPIQVSSTKVIVPVGEAYTVVTLGSTVTPLLGSSFVTLDAGSNETYQAIEANSNLILNGGQVCSYDGGRVTENGFHLAPFINSAVPSASGGSIGAGTYLYSATYRYTDEQGNIYESAPSIEVSVNQASGSTNSVPVVISTLTMTAKTGSCQIYLYRTTANGTNPVLVGKTSNDVTANTVTITDTLADSSTASATPLYTNGSVIPNSAPPAAIAMVNHKNRVWLVSSEIKNQVWYSQHQTPTAGVNFSGLLLMDVDTIGGACTALASMDDKLVIFEEKQPLVVYGDGPDATGQGSTLSNPQAIPSDTGATQSKGVIAFPGGVLFKSPKGIYLLDRSLGVKYFGAEVEAYNSQNIVSALIPDSVNQIRLLCDSGLTLVFDYEFGQWSTFTNHAGYGACNWGGKYVYARTSGEIYQETAGHYLDDTTAYAPLARLSWLAMGGVQGFQRVREFIMLGDYVNGASASHGVQVSAAYDFVETFSTPVPYLFGAAAASGVFQYEERLPRQKCDSVSLIIQEITTGDAAEYISFTDMSFNAGVKRGLNKLPNARSVG